MVRGFSDRDAGMMDALTEVMPALKGGMPDGLYFGMSEDDYHAAAALSSSGIKKMRVSTLDYWMDSVFNPRRDEEDPAESFAKKLGTAYHARLLYGKEWFYRAYAAEINKADYPKALVTADDLQGVIRKHMEEGGDKVKLAGKKAELVERVLAINPAAQIYDVIEASYLESHKGKLFLPARNIERIEIAAAMIERDPELSKMLTGGAAEVSIFWHCPVIGTPMKCRVDYLKTNAVIEVKSFGNPNDRPISEAIETAFASRRYQIGAALYCEGVSHIAQFIRDGKVTGGDPSLLEKLKRDTAKTYCFLWQSTGVAPVARGRVLPQDSIFFNNGKTEVEAAKMKFRESIERFGTDTPWVDAAPIEPFDDGRIPMYGLR